MLRLCCLVPPFDDRKVELLAKQTIRNPSKAMLGLANTILSRHLGLSHCNPAIWEKRYHIGQACPSVAVGDPKGIK